MKRLCAATDLSPRSAIAQRRAAMIAAAKGWGLTLLHAIDDDQPPEVLAAHRTAAEALLAAEAALIGAQTGVACDWPRDPGRSVGEHRRRRP